MKFHSLRALTARLTILLIAGLICASVAVQAASSSPVQNVSNDPTDSLQPRVAQDPDGNVHVVWVDDNGGGRSVRYIKGTWNGTAYTFGSSALLADVGSFQYSLPNIAVAPNGTIMTAWSNGTLQVKIWNSRDNQPSGTATPIGGGIQPSIAVDGASRFHVAWSGDSKIQYCQWEGASCTKRDSLSEEASNRPDIAVDSNNGVHVVWDGGGIKYRSRSGGAEWNSLQALGNGIKAQIAADGQGTVHVVYSNDYNIQYCRKTLTGGCTEQHTIDAGNDLDPSVGVTPAGSVIIGFREANTGRLHFDSRENGTWAGSREIGGGITVDVAPRLYAERTSLVWSRDYEIQHAVVSVVSTPPPPTFTGSLSINGGAPVTTQAQVNVTINSTSGTDVPTSFSLADGVEPGTPNQAFSNPTSTSFTLDVADGQCREHVVFGKLGSSTGTSAAFNSRIIYDPSAEALVIARNPNLPNPEINAFMTAAVPSGTTAYTRRQDFNTAIIPTINECSGLNRYAFVKHGNAITDAAWKTIPAEGFVSAFTPFGPTNGEGTYQFDVYVEDKVGNKTNTPYVVSIVYDVTAPTVSGVNGAQATTASPKGGIAQISIDGLTTNDNLYTDPTSSRKYWGYWVVVKKDSAGSPTENEWNQNGIVKPGMLPALLTWNMSRGLVGGIKGFTPGTHTVYIRYLDGAGNWSSTISSQSVQVNQLELFRRLPYVAK